MEHCVNEGGNLKIIAVIPEQPVIDDSFGSAVEFAQCSATPK